MRHRIKTFIVTAMPSTRNRADNDIAALIDGVTNEFLAREDVADGDIVAVSADLSSQFGKAVVVMKYLPVVKKTGIEKKEAV